MNVHHLTDDDLVAVANDMAGDLSYCVAGWDYPERNSRAAEENMYHKLNRQFGPVSREMRKRGLDLTVPSLVGLGR